MYCYECWAKLLQLNMPCSLCKKPITGQTLFMGADANYIKKQHVDRNDFIPRCGW